MSFMGAQTNMRIGQNHRPAKGRFGGWTAAYAQLAQEFLAVLYGIVLRWRVLRLCIEHEIYAGLPGHRREQLSRRSIFIVDAALAGQFTALPSRYWITGRLSDGPKLLGSPTLWGLRQPAENLVCHSIQSIRKPLEKPLVGRGQCRAAAS